MKKPTTMQDVENLSRRVHFETKYLSLTSTEEGKFGVVVQTSRIEEISGVKRMIPGNTILELSEKTHSLPEMATKLKSLLSQSLHKLMIQRYGEPIKPKHIHENCPNCGEENGMNEDGKFQCKNCAKHYMFSLENGKLTFFTLPYDDF